MTPLIFQVPKLIIEDINGEDLYPGDEIIIRLILKNNSGKALEEVIAVLVGWRGSPGIRGCLRIESRKPGIRRR